MSDAPIISLMLAVPDAEAAARQGGFLDPYGHLWLVGDRSPLRNEPPRNEPLRGEPPRNEPLRGEPGG